MVRVWTVSEVKAGTLTQCLGVGQHFDPEPHRVIVRNKFPRWGVGPLSPYRKLLQPEPDLIVSCGSMAPKHVFAIVASCRRKPFTVHLQTPQDEFARRYDMAFIARHDWRKLQAPLPGYHPMIGAPHRVTTQALAALRAPAREKWLPSGGRAVAVLIGGPNEGYRYDDETVEGLLAAIAGLADGGWRALVSTSRRSHPSMLERLLAINHPDVFVWDRTGDNPYLEFLAAADAVLVTKDTVTMTCEALATGKPTYVYDLAKTPSAKLDKFEWFHDDLSRTLKLTRPFRGSLDAYAYEPPDEAARIAGLIRGAMVQADAA